MGIYPDVGLKDARERRDDARGKVIVVADDPDTGGVIRICLGRRFALGVAEREY